MVRSGTAVGVPESRLETTLVIRLSNAGAYIWEARELGVDKGTLTRRISCGGSLVKITG
jgi:hypothetical protein